jgi:hypothetical protein
VADGKEADRMSDDKNAVVEAEFQQLTGALGALVTLREEFATWTEQSSDEGDDGTLGRVLDYIQSLESAYKNRKALVREKLVR